MASGTATWDAIEYVTSNSVIDLGQISAAAEYSSKIKVADKSGVSFSVNYQYVIAGITTTVVVRLQGSFDDENWFNLDDEEKDITHTANGTFSTVYETRGEIVYIRFYFVSEGSGTSSTIDIKAKPF